MHPIRNSYSPIKEIQLHSTSKTVPTTTQTPETIASTEFRPLGGSCNRFLNALESDKIIDEHDRLLVDLSKEAFPYLDEKQSQLVDHVLDCDLTVKFKSYNKERSVTFKIWELLVFLYNKSPSKVESIQFRGGLLRALVEFSENASEKISAMLLKSPPKKSNQQMEKTYVDIRLPDVDVVIFCPQATQKDLKKSTINITHFINSKSPEDTIDQIQGSCYSNFCAGNTQFTMATFGEFELTKESGNPLIKLDCAFTNGFQRDVIVMGDDMQIEVLPLLLAKAQKKPLPLDQLKFVKANQQSTWQAFVDHKGKVLHVNNPKSVSIKGTPLLASFESKGYYLGDEQVMDTSQQVPELVDVFETILNRFLIIDSEKYQNLQQQISSELIQFNKNHYWDSPKRAVVLLYTIIGYLQGKISLEVMEHVCRIMDYKYQFSKEKSNTDCIHQLLAHALIEKKIPYSVLINTVGLAYFFIMGKTSVEEEEPIVSLFKKGGKPFLRCKLPGEESSYLLIPFTPLKAINHIEHYIIDQKPDQTLTTLLSKIFNLLSNQKVTSMTGECLLLAHQDYFKTVYDQLITKSELLLDDSSAFLKHMGYYLRMSLCRTEKDSTSLLTIYRFLPSTVFAIPIEKDRALLFDELIFLTTNSPFAYFSKRISVFKESWSVPKESLKSSELLKQWMICLAETQDVKLCAIAEKLWITFAEKYPPKIRIEFFQTLIQALIPLGIQSAQNVLTYHQSHRFPQFTIAIEEEVMGKIFNCTGKSPKVSQNNIDLEPTFSWLDHYLKMLENPEKTSETGLKEMLKISLESMFGVMDIVIKGRQYDLAIAICNRALNPLFKAYLTPTFFTSLESLLQNLLVNPKKRAHMLEGGSLIIDPRFIAITSHLKNDWMSYVNQYVNWAMENLKENTESLQKIFQAVMTREFSKDQIRSHSAIATYVLYLIEHLDLHNPSSQSLNDAIRTELAPLSTKIISFLIHYDKPIDALKFTLHMGGITVADTKNNTPFSLCAHAIETISKEKEIPQTSISICEKFLDIMEQSTLSVRNTTKEIAFKGLFVIYIKKHLFTEAFDLVTKIIKTDAPCVYCGAYVSCWEKLINSDNSRGMKFLSLLLESYPDNEKIKKCIDIAIKTSSTLKIDEQLSFYYDHFDLLKKGKDFAKVNEAVGNSILSVLDTNPTAKSCKAILEYVKLYTPTSSHFWLTLFKTVTLQPDASLRNSAWDVFVAHVSQNNLLENDKSTLRQCWILMIQGLVKSKNVILHELIKPTSSIGKELRKAIDTETALQQSQTMWMELIQGILGDFTTKRTKDNSVLDVTILDPMLVIIKEHLSNDIPDADKMVNIEISVCKALLGTIKKDKFISAINLLVHLVTKRSPNPNHQSQIATLFNDLLERGTNYITASSKDQLNPIEQSILKSLNELLKTFRDNPIKSVNPTKICPILLKYPEGSCSSELQRWIEEGLESDSVPGKKNPKSITEFGQSLISFLSMLFKVPTEVNVTIVSLLLEHENLPYHLPENEQSRLWGKFVFEMLSNIDERTSFERGRTVKEIIGYYDMVKKDGEATDYWVKAVIDTMLPLWNSQLGRTLYYNLIFDFFEKMSEFKAYYSFTFMSTFEGSRFATFEAVDKDLHIEVPAQFSTRFTQALSLLIKGLLDLKNIPFDSIRLICCFVPRQIKALITMPRSNPKIIHDLIEKFLYWEFAFQDTVFNAFFSEATSMFAEALNLNIYKKEPEKFLEARINMNGSIITSNRTDEKMCGETVGKVVMKVSSIPSQFAFARASSILSKFRGHLRDKSLHNLQLCFEHLISETEKFAKPYKYGTIYLHELIFNNLIEAGGIFFIDGSKNGYEAAYTIGCKLLEHVHNLCIDQTLTPTVRFENADFLLDYLGKLLGYGAFQGESRNLAYFDLVEKYITSFLDLLPSMDDTIVILFLGACSSALTGNDDSSIEIAKKPFGKNLKPYSEAVQLKRSVLLSRWLMTLYKNERTKGLVYYPLQIGIEKGLFFGEYSLRICEYLLDAFNSNKGVSSSS